MSKISFAVIAHNTEQHCGFGSALPPQKPHITPGGQFTPVWEPLLYTIGVRGWGGLPPPGLKIFKANSVFRTSTSCSKFLNNKKYFQTVKNFNATLFFSASASCSKILNDKKYIVNTVKNFRETVFQGK